jgi:phytoene synthase
VSATASIELAAAYRHCEQLTRREAANFYYGIRLLPPPKRRAMCAVYALARQIDDIGDEEPPRADPLAELDATAEMVLAVRDGGGLGTNPVARALADAAARFPIPLDAFLELIEGVRSDVLGASYETEEQLVLYCRRVAGTIGRLCLGIFGSSELERAMGLADDLGVAMQLTNILRDVREDAVHGRVYLPAADLRRVGWSGSEPIAGAELLARIGRGDELVPVGTAELVAIEAARAHAWFARGMALVPLLDRRSQACVQAMTGIYRRLLERIEDRPEEVLRRRLALTGWEKAWVAASSAIGSAT